MSAQPAPAAVEYDDENNHPAAGTFYNRGSEVGLDHYPAADGEDRENPNIEVTVYHGVKDGKPVLQIDTHGENVDFRINVNDGTVWDSGTDSGEWGLIHNAAKEQAKLLRHKALYGTPAERTAKLEEARNLEAALGKLA
jgi:hypothetical protein